MNVGRPATGPLYLDVAPDAVFAFFHAPAAGTTSDTAVLICPPWGWDEIASYRARGAWGAYLADRGHPTLRIDLPGCGDSAGDPGEPELVAAWRHSIEGAAGWLAALPGVSRVAAIGLGLGGLLAAATVADGAAIDDLVLWAAPVHGRAFAREQRAFAALQGSRLAPIDDSDPAPLPDGWLEVGGFVLSAETIATLGPLDLASLPLGRLERALLLERDGMGQDRELEASLKRDGVEVTAAPGQGWTDMVFHPERYRPPLVVFERVAEWLAAAPTRRPRTPRIEAPRVMDRLELCLDGTCIQEAPIQIDQPFGQVLGLLARPVELPLSPVCAIFLNAGAVRRIGPNRLWVEIARRWAARGVPTIRMDLEGIGDADGDPSRYLDVGNFYTPAFGAQVTTIVDALQARGLGPQFVLIGLCAGAYWAFHTAASDSRVIEAIIVNPRAMVWDPDLLARREARKVERLLEPALWQGLLRSKVPPSRMLAVSRAMARTAVRAVIRAARRTSAADRARRSSDVTEGRLDALQKLGTRVVLAFADDEPVHDELMADGVLTRSDRWPVIELMHLPGRDHTLRPIVAQRALHVMLEAELDRLVGTGGVGSLSDLAPQPALEAWPRQVAAPRLARVAGPTDAREPDDW